MTLRISEIYGSVAQGEGVLLGERMPFVRVAGCNLSCSWCDSAYTWKPGYAYTAMSVADVLDALSPLLGDCRWVSLTGGEPTLYAECGALAALLWSARGVRCIVETNGLRNASWLLEPSVFTSCSPKLPGSGQDSPARRERVRRLVDAHHAKARERTQYKFVIANADDLAALPDYCASVGIPTDGSALVYVQPNGYVQPLGAYLDALAWLQACAPTWARVTPQVHRLIYGPDARSV